MSTTEDSKADAATAIQDLGFSTANGSKAVDWSDYLAFRPAYPPSFFEKVFGYHGENPDSTWDLAQDIGAGCGIVSSSLASRFTKVIVSDPNDGYIKLAREILVDKLLLPESKFQFLQERAEKSPVESGTVALITACACIHWTDTDAAIQDFGRKLQSGGSLAITNYSIPRVIGNEKAQEAWGTLCTMYSTRAQSPLLDRALQVMNSGLDCLELPEETWHHVKRLYINAHGNVDAFKTNDRVAPSKVKETEVKAWEENDSDWISYQDFTWFRGFASTLDLAHVPKDEVQPLWDAFEAAVGKEKVQVETSVSMVFARKK